MKHLFFSIFFVFVTFPGLNAQSEIEYSRKGKFLFETNYSFASTLFGGSTGLGLIFSEGEALINMGIDCGKFARENFAVKGSFFVLTANGESLVGLSAGFKYYAGGRFIINPSLGILTAGGEREALASLHLGYAVKLANNIYLEPAIGYRAGVSSGSGGLLDLRLPFMLLF